jgi:hypothetical protein
MELFDRVFTNLVERKERVLSGKINCIPFGLPRFEEELPGIEQRTYYQVTANTKVGKTQITDFLFMYKSLMYAYKNKEQLRLKIFYFSLEMSKEQKYQQMICHLLFVISNGKIRITPKDLRSTRADRPLPDRILEIIKTDEYQEFFKFFEENVIFIDDIRNPFGIYDFCRKYAQANGTQYRKMHKFVNKTGEETETEIDDYYEPNDPEEYVEIIVDHAALMSPEKGGTVRDAMIKFSSDYAIKLRNKYKYIPIVIIQQAAAQESNDNMKLNKLRPTLDGYGDAKVISRDADVIIGLFSPFRYGIPTYLGYDTTILQDNIRFMEIIAGREGGGGTISPLFFDGGVNFFAELPKPDNVTEMRNVYNLVEKVRSNNVFLFIHKFKK